MSFEFGTGGLCSENMTLCQHNYAIMPPNYATHYAQVEVHYAVLCRTMPPTVFYICCYVCVQSCIKDMSWTEHDRNDCTLHTAPTQYHTAEFP